MSRENTGNKKQHGKKKKRTALIICQNESRFWTTQAQFWQWVREFKVTKLGDNPLTGKLNITDEESQVILGNNILNLVHRNHLSEVLSSRRYLKRKR